MATTELRKFADVPTNPTFNQTWAKRPLEQSRQAALLAAEQFLDAADSIYLQSVRRERLQHTEVYTFDGNQWVMRSPYGGDGWSTISADGTSIGFISSGHYTPPPGIKINGATP